MINKLFLHASIAIFLSSCASLSDHKAMRMDVRKDANKLTKSVIEDSKKPEKDHGLEKVKSKEKIPFSAINNWDSNKGNFNVSTSGKFADVVDFTAKRGGYGTIIYVDGVDKNKLVNISLDSVSPEFAIRRIAYAAGYVAIVDKKTKSVTISDQAVYTFKLPSNVFTQLNQSVSSTFNAGSSGGVGGVGGVTNGGTSNFNVNGMSGTQNGGVGGAQLKTGITTFIEKLAGKNADITVNEDIGMVTIRSNAVALERVRTTLNKLAEVASRRVSVEATFIEVSLGDVFEYGIDWSRVLSSSGKTFGITGGGSANLSSATGNFQYTLNNITSIISALKTYTDVTVMSQPKIETGNRVPTTFFDGFSIPYLGSIQAVQQQTSSSTAGTISYADDGVRLSFVPDIVSDNEVQFLLMPTLSSVGEEKTFNLGGGSSLTDFVRAKKEALLTVNLEDGQTAIIGGLRSSKNSGNQKTLPGFSKNFAIGSKVNSDAREVVLLLHANVVSGKPQDTLFSESL